MQAAPTRPVEGAACQPAQAWDPFARLFARHVPGADTDAGVFAAPLTELARLAGCALTGLPAWSAYAQACASRECPS
jgi:hypothetical protein